MKALIIYGSSTGNTEHMALTIGQALENAGVQTEIKEVTGASPVDLTTDHDLLLLGCPAYGEEEIELQEEFQEFYEGLGDINLAGRKLAVFAPGDSAYEHFCGSVDVLEKKMEELGGQIVLEGLKVDGDPGDAENEILEWSKELLVSVS
jgi:flavodoxin short chain